MKKLMPKNNDLGDVLLSEGINAAVESFVNELKRNLSNAECEDHPNSMSRITVVADRKKTIIVEKDFCCRKFNDLVQIKID